jgi:hypothetical protein
MTATPVIIPGEPVIDQRVHDRCAIDLHEVRVRVSPFDEAPANPRP